MKTLFLDCSMGASGDMLTAALSELLPDKGLFLDKVNSLGLPGVRVSLCPDSKCGIAGTHAEVTVHGMIEGKHEAHRPHHHAHGSAGSDESISALRNISDKVRNDIKNIYSLLRDAEARAHGCPVEQVHFHELGDLDALADIAGVCILMEMLSPDCIVCSPVNTGHGQVKCAHGILPVPAPATAFLLMGVPSYGGSIAAELCTPTGAALIKYFASSFGPMPEMTVSAIGHGLGTRDFEAANCLRAMLGESESASPAPEGTVYGEVSEICCNLDDMTPEDIALAQKKLFDAGALDVYTVPIYMKKNRPGVMLCCICELRDEKALASVMLRHTSTLGVRINTLRRVTLPRHEETVSTDYGPIRVKCAEFDGLKKIKPEHDDIAEISERTGMTAAQIRALLN